MRSSYPYLILGLFSVVASCAAGRVTESFSMERATSYSRLDDPAQNLVVIMKDGKIYKNTLTAQRVATASPH